MLCKREQYIILILLVSIMYGCNGHSNPSISTLTETISRTPLINYSVINYYPHDTALYTEGLVIHNGQLFESTGSPGDLPQTRSLIGITNLSTGKFDKKIELDKTKYFGEGIVFFKEKLYQLTYQNQKGFIYDAKSFKQLDTFTYRNIEGWSLTTDGKDLIMSDGTDALTFLNPADVKPNRILKVTENGMRRDSLNELEYIKGFIYANIWVNNCIVKIDPANGKVVGKLDLSSLKYDAMNKNPGAQVLNGIAYDSITDKIYVTGKMWSNIYQISFPH